MEDKVEAQTGAPAVAEDADAPKLRLKKPVKPDVEEHKAAVEQLQQEMQKRRARVEEIKQIIDQKRQSGGGPEVSKARSKLNELSSGFKAELEKKKGLRAELQSINTQRDGLRAKLRELKAKVGNYGTAQKIDEKIASLEYRINHHTLDLKEENRTRDEMKKLAVLKPLVDVYVREEAALKATDGTRQQVLDRLRACDERLSAIKAEEETQRAHVSELRNSEAAKSQDVPTLAKERDECREVMNALWQKIQELREEHRARHNQFWEEQKAWQQQQLEERRLKQMAREKEYAERDAARRAAAAEYAGEPYNKEIALCDQLSSHLGKYMQQGEETSPAAAPSAATGSAEAFQGMKAVKKKAGDGQQEEGFGVFYGTGGKKAKGRKTKAASAGQANPGDLKLNHSLDIIDAFSKLKVSMPATASKVPEALKQVEERKAYWLKKRADAEKGGVVVGEEPEAASSSRTAKPAGAKPKANGVLDLDSEGWPDIAGNVGKGGKATGGVANAGGPSNGGLVTVQLAFVGDKVSVTCTSL